MPLPQLTSDILHGIAARLMTAGCVESLGAAAHGALAPFGFRGMTFAVVRRVKNIHLHARVFSTWPQPIQSSFEQQKLFQADPIIIKSRTASRAFVWDLSIYDAAISEHAALLDIRRTAGITGGVCIPVNEAWNGRSVLYLTGDGISVDDTSVLNLELLAAFISSRVYALQGQTDFLTGSTHVFMSVGELSPRERQVFGWIAFGKSSREIATIMAISEHTVNDYIATVMAKLKASNRTEAVLRALLTNQIDLT